MKNITTTILAFFLTSTLCLSQSVTDRYDTVKVVMLVSDTAHAIEEYMSFVPCKDVGCKDTTLNHFNFVSHYKIVKEDKGNSGYGQSYWVYGYSVREKHNTDEWKIDPYSSFGYVSRDYWVHIFYLNSEKQPIKKTLIIWQSVPSL